MTPDEACEQLSRHLPQAVLLLGPGSWELGTELGRVYGTTEDISVLDADTARRLRDEVQFEPVSPPSVYLVRLDRASALAQNMLLKVLEEPPSWMRFILTASREPLKTIVSRCQVLTLGDAAALAEPDLRVKGQVGTAVKAVRNGSRTLLVQALNGWEAAHGQLLEDWALEAAAGRWRRFDPGFAPGVLPGQALALLTALSRYKGSKLAPLVALTEVFSPR